MHVQVLGPPGFDSSYLQQAAHLTGGLYLRAPSGSGTQGGGVAAAGGLGVGMGVGSFGGPSPLQSQQQKQHCNLGAALQYLLSCLSSDTVTRSMLRVHQPLGVDFRATCFCHKRALNVGYVCSVCLSIFCKQLPQCAICGTTFTSTQG